MSKANMSKLLDAVNKAKGSQGFSDPMADKFWKAEPDAAGNAYAVIRFLPGKTEDDVPFVKTYSHGFKSDSGKWFIEDCPTTIGENCPVCESNSPLWNSGNDKDKDIVRQRKRKVAYVSNVLVVSDSKHPEKEGKVFLFKYGQKIFDKVVGALTPEFEDEKPLNPFDPAEGANFKLKMRKVEGYSNFDKSEFDKPAEIGSDKEIAKVLAQLHDLNYFVSKDKFKSYDDLSKKLSGVIGGAVRSNVKSSRDEDEDEDAAFIKEAKSSKPAAKPAAAPADDDDDLAFFAKLAAEE